MLTTEKEREKKRRKMKEKQQLRIVLLAPSLSSSVYVCMRHLCVCNASDNLLYFDFNNSIMVHFGYNVFQFWAPHHRQKEEKKLITKYSVQSRIEME